MDFNFLYQHMFNSVVSGGMQKIINAAYEIIRLPLVVVDTSYNVLAVSNSEATEDNIFDTLVRDKRASAELVWLFHKDKYIESVCNSNKPVYLNWGSLKIPQISGAIRVNGIIRGYIGVVCPQSEFRDELIEATSIIVDALALDMKNQKNENTQNNPLLEIFTRDLLNGVFHSEDKLETWKSNFSYVFKKKYMLTAILPPSDGEARLLDYFSSVLSSRYQNVLSTIIEDKLFLLFYNLHSESELGEIKEFLGRKLASFHACYSISKDFSSILDVPSYRFQVEKALELGTLIHPEQRFYQYEGYIISTIFHYALKEMDSVGYVNPIIYQLADFDKKNNTDYLMTLQTYIVYICNSRRTAEKLHIHRNTLLYRLNKISELTNCNFDDENICTQLMLSFQLMKLKKQLDKSTQF